MIIIWYCIFIPLHFFFRFQYNNLALNYSLKSLFYNTKMVGCVPYIPLYIYATSGRILKSIRRIPQNQTFKFYLSLPAPRFPNLPERRRSPPCLVRLWLIGDMSFISFYAFASKLFCRFSTPTASSPASGMPLLAFPHASLYIMHISVCLAASALVVYIVHPLLE